MVLSKEQVQELGKCLGCELVDCMGCNTEVLVQQIGTMKNYIDTITAAWTEIDKMWVEFYIGNY